MGLKSESIFNLDSQPAVCRFNLMTSFSCWLLTGEEMYFTLVNTELSKRLNWIETDIRMRLNISFGLLIWWAGVIRLKFIRNGKGFFCFCCCCCWFLLSMYKISSKIKQSSAVLACDSAEAFGWCVGWSFSAVVPKHRAADRYRSVVQKGTTDLSVWKMVSVSSMKYLTNYWTNCQDMCYRYLLASCDPHWRTTSRSTF